jgi:hypothetical protein
MTTSRPAKRKRLTKSASIYDVARESGVSVAQRSATCLVM